jgi:hypothetical protein
MGVAFEQNARRHIAAIVSSDEAAIGVRIS